MFRALLDHPHEVLHKRHLVRVYCVRVMSVGVERNSTPILVQSTDITYLLTPWSRILLEKLTHFVASQEISCVLLNLKVHYCIHKSPLPVSILSQPNPVHTPTSHFLKIHFNIILPSTPGSPQWPLSLGFPHLKPIHTSLLPQTRYMPRPSHVLDFITRTILGEEYRS
jgi:hypothetical protein